MAQDFLALNYLPDLFLAPVGHFLRTTSNYGVTLQAQDLDMGQGSRTGHWRADVCEKKRREVEAEKSVMARGRTHGGGCKQFDMGMEDRGGDRAYVVISRDRIRERMASVC